jgi:MurNAc alpha-1-phosphate uridylyltransferase
MIYPVVILAGGIGSRLGRLTKKTPKALIKVNGKPFIHYQLTLLSKQGIKKVILCIGHLGNKIKKFVGDGKQFNLEVKYSYEKKLLGTGGAIKNAFSLIKKNFFIMYGDTYLPINFINVQNRYKRLKYNSLITVYKNQNNLDKSNVFFNGKRIVYDKKNYLKKMKYIEYGLSIFNKKIFKYFSKKKKFDLSDVFYFLSKKKLLNYYIVKKRFYEIGSISGLKDSKKYLKSVYKK